MKHRYNSLSNIPPGHARIEILNIICVDLFHCLWDDLVTCIMREREVLRPQAINLAHKWIEDKLDFRARMGWQEYREDKIKTKIRNLI